MPKTVLIAEDDKFLQKMLTMQLGSTKHTVEIEHAYNGDEAIKRIEKGGIDLVMLDILMPKIDGFAVLEHLKKTKKAPPVIVMSNLGQKEDIQKCMDLGAKDYIVKSDIDTDDLVGKLSKYIS